MQLAGRVRVVSKVVRVSANTAVCGGLLLALPAWAASGTPPPGLVDLHVMAELEARAGLASPKEQAYLYADLADRMTLLADRQIAEGEIEKAEETLLKLESCTSKMESNFQQSKSLKKTEMMLHLTNRRLTDMARAASADVKPHVQEALKRLNSAQTSLLATLFAK